MEPVRRLPAEIDEVLSRGGIILTSNQRAARTFRLEFDRQRRSEDLTSWRPPNIFAWDTWLSSLWHEIVLEGRANYLVLNRSQELQIWRSAILADPDANSLQSVEALATIASQAWQRLCAYCGQSRLNSLGISADTRAFQRWAQAFSRRLKTSLYLTQSELEAAIASLVAADGFRPPSNELLLIGFDIFTPAQETLLDALREVGVSTSQQASAHTPPEVHLATSRDLDDELVQAALWLREHLTDHPDARIAVIHPDIASERAELDRVFRRILAPELQDITADLTSGPYEFSLGNPLSQQPMIAIALQLLRWAIAPLPIENISQLLLSSFFARHASERRHRAEFDVFELRRVRLLRPELELSSVMNQVERSRNTESLPRLLTQLQDTHRAATTLVSGNKQKSFADWADSIRGFLHAAAWATSAPDTSIEFQTRSKWESVLDELATLDFEGTRCTIAEALGALEQIAQRTLFAPESHGAPIQIMSPLEAAGSTFDAIYFLRASDLAWPTRPGIDSLLGWRLQRDLQTPGSDAVRDAEDAKRITERIAASAPTVIFSYAQETPDAHQRPSPSLAALLITPIAAPQFPASPEPIELETLEDSTNIPLKDARTQGGSSILQLQAACGFRAFAEKRLFSTAPESREPGMDARERGDSVHVALQQLWTELHTQANLRSLTLEQRNAELSRAIDYSLRKVEVAADSAWDSAYLGLQRERLHRLLSVWLEVELTRPPFEVELREQEYEDVAIGPLRLSLRIDRIDRVFNETGEALGEVILDYKTGIAGPSDWQTERPDEPQLPLYAALREPGTVAAIAFASLRPGKEMGLSGLAAGDGILPRAARFAFESLEDQIADWHRILTNLAIDFSEGDARVRPKSYPSTCEFCRQRIVCRVDPAIFEGLNDEGDEADA